MNRFMTRRELLQRGGFLSAALLSGKIGSTATKSAPRTNVVILMADSLGYVDLGIYGSPDIRTPEIDRLARQGVRFTRFYTGAPESTPARAAFLTGRYPQRVGGLECDIGFGGKGQYDDALRLAEKHELGLPASELTLSKLLKQGGYAAALIGKWHLGYEIPFYPINFGFDYFFGPLGGELDYFHHVEPDGSNQLFRNQEPVRQEGYLTDLIAAESVQFIQRQKKEKPFFLFTAFTAPHAPYQAPNDSHEKSLTEADWEKGSRETYVKMVERMDERVGKILSELERLGFVENTLVVFCSSNGGDRFADNGLLAQGRGSLFEGGIRVPCIVRWPGKISQESVTHKVTIAMDIPASIARAAGLQSQVGRPFDGIDILAEIERDRADMSRTFFWRYRRGDLTQRAARDGDMKYISEQKGGDAEADDKQMTEYLFDLADDPEEKKNLIKSRSESASSLRGLLRAWEREVKPAR